MSLGGMLGIPRAQFKEIRLSIPVCLSCPSPRPTWKAAFLARRRQGQASSPAGSARPCSELPTGLHIAPDCSCVEGFVDGDVELGCEMRGGGSA